jgi:hypothetical protein
MSCEFLQTAAETLIEKLSPEIQFEILDILPADELGQDTDEVVLQWSNSIYAGGLNEMVYYLHMTMDEVTLTIDVCVDEQELISIVDPDWIDLDKLTAVIKSELIK